MDSIELDADVRAFLVEPVSGLMPLLFDPLFELLKGNMDLKGFEESSANKIETACRKHLASGYSYWVILSLVKLLEPSAYYSVPTRDEHCDSALGDATPDHYFQENVPDAEPANHICFQQHGLHQAFIVPKILVRSDRLNNFTAAHFRFYDSEAYNRANSFSPRQEWLVTADLVNEHGATNLWPDLAFYSASELSDLSLVADYLKTMRPDVIVEIKPEADWHKGQSLDMIRRHERVLKPRLGTYVICREKAPEAVVDRLRLNAEPVSKREEEQQASIKPAGDASEAPQNIHVLSVGYDLSQLVPIVAAMAGTGLETRV